jgi:VWFA-related protein
VDVIVTDKRGHYLKELNQRDFHVFEDGKEQPVTSLSHQADIQRSSPEHQQYMVLFFDNMTMEPQVQMLERDAAAKFVEAKASPNHMMAVMDYGGGLRLDQDFTSNGELLKNVVSKIKFGSFEINPDAATLSGPGAHAAQQEADFALRGLLGTLRDVAKMLGKAPGRKTLIFFSAGFDFPPAAFASRQSDFQDAIDALNKANVGVYPVDSAGLAVPTGRGASGGTLNEILYTLAAQTGGFPIVNTNDLQGGMEKVADEMDQYYILSYTPPHPAHDGRYHRIHVKVDGTGIVVRARNGYLDAKTPDLPVASTQDNALEAKATSFEAGENPVTLFTTNFYTGPGLARVNLTLSIPGSAIEFEKHGEDFHSRVSVLGIASRDDGSVAARLSDTVNLDYQRDEKEAATRNPFEYQNSFKIAPGEYTFKLVLSAGGKNFGKYVVPLLIDPFSGTQLTVSGPAFGDRVVRSALSPDEIDQALIEGSAPMVANGLQVIPSSNNHFKKGTHPVAYVEVYDPLLQTGALPVGILFDIVDRKTNQKAYSSNTLPINQYARAGKPLVPVIFKLPLDNLQAGDYRIEIWGRDSAQNVSPVRTADFTVE